MSITTTSTKDSYTGNNSTSTPYPITFKYLEDSHITVYVDGVALSNSYYTLTGDGSLGTGQFTTALEYAGTQKVVVVLDVPFNQPVELLETGALSSSTLEEAYDRLNMQIRRVWRKAQDVLTFSSDEGGAGSTGTADNLLGFDSTGNLTEIPYNSAFGNGTVQGTDAVRDIRMTATDDQVVTNPDPRGEDSIDLQGYRDLATEVASGKNSVLVGGYSNTASGENSGVITGGKNIASGGKSFVAGGFTNTASSRSSVVIGGEDNTASGSMSSVLGGEDNTVMSGKSSIIGGLDNLIDTSNPNSVILGGRDNQMTGSGGTNTILSAKDSTCTAGFYNFIVGQQGHDGGSSGVKLFADGSTTPFTAKANNEFGVQCDNFRLELGTPAVGDVLTCNNTDGSSEWATPSGIKFAQYSITNGTTSNPQTIPITEEIDPDNIGTVSGGEVTLGAGTYQITHYGEYDEDDNDSFDYFRVHTRHNGSTKATFTINETDDVTVSNGYLSRSATFLVTSASSQTVDIEAEQLSGAILNYRNVRLSILKLA